MEIIFTFAAVFVAGGIYHVWGHFTHLSRMRMLNELMAKPEKPKKE